MNMPMDHTSFQKINKGYNRVFKPQTLSVGLVVPLESYAHHASPTMQHQLERIQLAESLGFSAVWLRDVPFDVPSFGDTGQIFDPWVYLGLLAGQTSEIALGVSSIILPLRHPAHIAKAAASVDVLSGGRLILGIASGDRPEEYPAMNLSYQDRGERFQQGVHYIRHMWDNHPVMNNAYGETQGNINMLPKPTAGRLPLLITGTSQQSTEWIAQQGDGWMIYPRPISQQMRVIDDWQTQVHAAGRVAQPIMQPLYIDLVDNATAPPQPLHLGFSSGSEYLCEYLSTLATIGVNHVALNLRFNQANIENTLKKLASDVLVKFTH